MFEEEVEERFVKSYPQFCCNGKPLSPFWDLWQAGAEYGYNKANEWHYVKDGLPKETKKYFIYSKEWGVEVRKFFADVGYFECRKNDDVIAWKEIVLPEPPKYWDLSTGENNINKENE